MRERFGVIGVRQSDRRLKSTTSVTRAAVALLAHINARVYRAAASRELRAMS
ncbi:MAG: hypothetical protein ACR2HE_03345 [Casimicrobiaceae bacterium]